MRDALITRHKSHVTRHKSHVTRHKSHVTRHKSHVTRHKSHVTHTSHNSHFHFLSHILRYSGIRVSVIQHMSRLQNIDVFLDTSPGKPHVTPPPLPSHVNPPSLPSAPLLFNLPPLSPTRPPFSRRRAVSAHTNAMLALWAGAAMVSKPG